MQVSNMNVRQGRVLTGSRDMRSSLVRFRRVFAWVFPTTSTALTAGYFLLMAQGSGWLFRPAIGHYGSVSIVIAFGILIFIAAGVWTDGRLSRCTST